MAVPRLHIGRAARVAVNILREGREFRRAAKRVPKPVTWDWARPRLLPLLAGPWFDAPGEPLVRTVLPPGPAVTFSIPVGPGFIHVDRVVAERWECSTQQLLDAAMDNLRRRCARLPAETVRTGTLGGRLIRIARRPTWVSSLVFVPDELVRLFGADDQFIAAPAHSVLVSFTPDTPPADIAQIAIGLEQSSTCPLWLAPFALADGRLHWDEGADEEDDDL